MVQVAQPNFLKIINYFDIVVNCVVIFVFAIDVLKRGDYVLFVAGMAYKLRDYDFVVCKFNEFVTVVPF